MGEARPLPFSFSSAAMWLNLSILSVAHHCRGMILDIFAAARQHVEVMEARVAKQLRVIEQSDLAGQDSSDARNLLLVLEQALTAMRFEIVRLLPTSVDASRVPSRVRSRSGRKRVARPAKAAVANSGRQ